MTKKTNSPVPPAPALGNEPGILRYILSPGFYVLLVVAAVLVVVGLWVAAGDPHGDQQGYFFMAVAAPILPTLWAVLGTLRSELPDAILSLSSVVSAALLATLPLTLVATVTLLIPRVTQKIYDSRLPRDGFHYFFAADDGHPALGALLSVGLLGVIVAMLAGLLAVVLVVLPVVAFKHKRAFAEQNLLDTAPEFAKDNAHAGQGLTFLLILVFLIPTLIVVGAGNAHADSLAQAFRQCWNVFGQPQTYWADMAWVLGVCLIPVGVFLIVFVRIKQHPDRVARAALGVNALGDGKPRSKK